MEEKYYYLNHDLVFKYIFGTNANKKFTERLLELYFDKPIGSLNDIIILNSVKLIPYNIKTRKLELDTLVYIPSLNTKVILEMQNKFNNATFTKRSIYLCSVIIKEYKSGEKEFTSTSKIKEIIFADHICEYYKNATNGYLYLTRGINKLLKVQEQLVDFDIVDIAKYDGKCYNNDVTELEMLISLIKANTQEKLKEIWNKSKKFPFIKEVITEMDKFNKELYGQEYWLNDVLYRTELKKEYNEGKLTGLNERNYEIALKMLENNKSLEEINSYTDIPIKELNKLKKSSKIYKY